MFKTKNLKLLLAIGMIAFGISAQGVVNTWDCGDNGDNVIATLYDNGTMTIDGVGNMADWTALENVPWNSVRSSITNLVINSGVTSIGDYAFSACSALKEVTIGEDVEIIGDYAFILCIALKEIIIPESVESIGKQAFSGCSGLMNVSILEGVTIIGERAFEGCSGLTSLTIPESVTSIGYSAFYGCENLETLSIDNGVIGKQAFEGCIGLISVAIGEGVTSIGNRAFRDCSGLTGALTIPNSVEIIENSAFYGCSGLISVNIGDGVTSIGDNAFLDCSSLTFVTIGENLTSIGELAFRNCSGLTKITFLGNQPNFGSGIFAGIPANQLTLYYPKGNVTWEGFSYSGVNLSQWGISFDSNGGSDVPQPTVAYGETATIPDNPVREGFIFIGWYNGSELFDFATPITEDITLTAKWEKLQEIKDTVINGIACVLVEAGTFTMGGTQVTLTEDFWIGKYEVTQAQYEAVIGENPSYFTQDLTNRANKPVEMVTWFNADDFATKIGGFLPTEAQWEYAARGGKNSKGYTYSGSNTIYDVAWHLRNSEGYTHKVGTKAENELGIYDMSGNVWEWTADLYQLDYPIPEDHIGPRVIRGGSWNCYDYECAVSYRSSNLSSIKSSIGGFRVLFPRNLTIKTISFNSNGGTVISDMGVPVGASITPPSDPTRTGFTFAGWYKDEDLTDLWDFTNDKVEEDMTLYAQWTITPTGLPVIWIETENAAVIADKENYVPMSFKLTDQNNPENNVEKLNFTDGGIRGRGNTTWTYEKKPYRMKFDKKTKFFGLPAAKNWVLLADYSDPTLLKNAIAFELGDKLGLPFNHTYHFVELYLNGVYQGNYLFTEHTQVGEGRVDIDEKDGWLVELAFQYDEQPKFTTTNYELKVMIKSPEPEEDETNINNPAFKSVKKDLNELCDSMASVNFPDNGYRELIDMDVLIKYFFIQNFMKNNDFNHPGGSGSAYFYKDENGQISGGPLWDFDISCGLDWVNNPHYTEMSETAYSGQIFHSYAFYNRFYQDPVFRVKWKEFWNNNETKISSIPDFIDSMATVLEASTAKNDSKWRSRSRGAPDGKDAAYWREEIKWFFTERTKYLDKEYNKVEVLPASKNFGVIKSKYSEMPAQKFTLVSFGDMTNLSKSLKNGESSKFEISTELTAEEAGNGGYLAAITVKPKTSLSAGQYKDTLILSGENQDSPFSIKIPLSFTFNPDSFSVVFMNDEAEHESVKVETGETVSEPDGEPTKTGYSFAGWLKDEAEFDFATPITGNITLTAQWTINQYTVSFDSNEGSEVAPVTTDYNTTVTAPENPTRKGYTFAGWYIGETAFDFDTPITENITLTAKWTIKQFTVTFDSNEGSEIAPVKTNYNTAITKPDDPTRKGYTFAGWYIGETAFDFTTLITQNITLTAKWTANNQTPIIDKEKSAGKMLFKSTIVSTQMEIMLDEMRDIRFVVYDMTGNVVADGRGKTWDLRNSAGRFVANGTYLVIAEAKDMNGKVYSYSAKLGVKR